MGKITDPALLSQLGAPPSGAILTTAPVQKPPSGYTPQTGGGLAPTQGGPEDVNTIAAQAAAKAQADAAAQRAKDLAVQAQAKALEHQNQVTAPTPPEYRTNAAAQAPVTENYQRDLDQLRSLYTAGPGATAPYSLGSLKDYLPTQANTAFDQKANTFRGLVMQAKNLSSGQTNSPQEVKVQVDPYIPQSSDYDANILQKMDELQRLIDASRVSNAIKAGQPIPAQQQNRQQVTPPGMVPSGTGGAPGGGSPGGGGTPPGPPLINSNLPPDPGAQTTLTPGGQNYSIGPDPALAGANDHVRAMVGAGASAEEVQDYLNKLSPGLGNTAYPLVQKQVQFRKQHPEVPLSSYPVEVDRKAFPMSSFAAGRNNLAQSPLGTFTATGANALTAGLLPYATDNPRLTQAAIAGLSTANPKSALAGDLAGGALSLYGIDAGLARAGVKGAGMFGARPLIGDATYGAVSGAANNPDAPFTGALTGVAANVAGGVAGRGVTGGLASAVAPRAEGMTDLYAAGVRPTIGQRFANRGPIGAAVNGIEEAAQSLPGVGYAIRGARQQARDQFERGAFNSTLSELKPINDIMGGPSQFTGFTPLPTSLPKGVALGTEAHGVMQKATNDAYDLARSHMNYVPDAQGSADETAFWNWANSGELNADDQASLRKLVDTHFVSRLARSGGALSGDNYKNAISDLTKAAGRVSATRPQLSSAIKDYVSIIDAGARRSSPQAASDLMDAADAAYAKQVRLEMASAARGGDTGRFTPAQFDRAVQKASGGVRSRAYLRGDALMGDYAEQGKGLVDRLPNSGTTDRLLATQGVVGGALGGGVMGGLLAPATALKLGGVALPYVPIARDVVGATLAPHESPAANAIGRFIRNHQRIPGMFAAPYALSYAQGN